VKIWGHPCRQNALDSKVLVVDEEVSTESGTLRFQPQEDWETTEISW